MLCSLPVSSLHGLPVMRLQVRICSCGFPVLFLQGLDGSVESLLKAAEIIVFANDVVGVPESTFEHL